MCICALTGAAAQQQQQVPGGVPGAQGDIQRIAAVVNDDIITLYDLNQRMSLVLAATGGVDSREEYLQLRDEVLRSMVDERLQIQEAKSFDLTISDKEVDQAISDMARNNNMSREEFESYLERIGSDVEALKPQIRASIAWQRLVRGRYGSQIDISESEVAAVLQRMKQNAGEPEYLVSEIFLIVDSPEESRKVSRTARRLVRQIREGADFAGLARQFSDSATAAVGGDLAWVQGDQLAPTVSDVLPDLDIGEVSDPINAPGGYYIIKLRDRRKILAPDPMDVSMMLKQIAVPIAEDATGDESAALRNRMQAAAEMIVNCDDVPVAAGELGTTSYGDVGRVQMRELPNDIRNAVIDLDVGQVSTPIIRGGQMQVLIVCDREAPEVSPPSEDAIENSLMNQRLAMMSRRYLRDLRRDAIIDYR